MPKALAPNDIYTEGGKVQAGRGLYIVRQADADLYDCCKAGRIAYVLHTRQIGKSSLLASVGRALKTRGVAVAVLDMTGLGTSNVPEQWYQGILEEIAEQLELETDVADWWDSQGHLGFTHRMRRFFSHVVVRECEQRVVIFFDEIDTTLALPYTDDFFAAIRELYQARDNEPELARLSFVIAGSASPNDLMKDSTRTPFNVGQHIELNDFTFEEALPLAQGFPTERGSDRVFLAHVMEWTGGHPYLTQVLASRITKAGSRIRSVEDIDEIVRQTFLSTQGDQDRNLRFVSDMLTKRAERIGRDKVLLTYRDVLSGKSVPDRGQSEIVCHLKLAGVVRVVGDCLKVRNEIYRRALSLDWANEHISFSWKRLAIKLTTRAILPFAISAALVAVPVEAWFRVRLNELEDEREKVLAQLSGLESEQSKQERIYQLKRQLGLLQSAVSQVEQRYHRQRTLLTELTVEASERALTQKRDLITYSDESLTLLRQELDRVAIEGK
ncbi:MAG TPA: AAA-like domain-containing protein [Polyangiaceae bacterium]